MVDDLRQGVRVPTIRELVCGGFRQLDLSGIDFKEPEFYAGINGFAAFNKFQSGEWGVNECVGAFRLWAAQAEEVRSNIHVFIRIAIEDEPSDFAARLASGELDLMIDWLLSEEFLDTEDVDYLFIPEFFEGRDKEYQRAYVRDLVSGFFAELERGGGGDSLRTEVRTFLDRLNEIDGDLGGLELFFRNYALYANAAERRIFEGVSDWFAFLRFYKVALDAQLVEACIEAIDMEAVEALSDEEDPRGHRRLACRAIVQNLRDLLPLEEPVKSVGDEVGRKLEKALK